jgi:Ca2+-binding RTX toxin-like protein
LGGAFVATEVNAGAGDDTVRGVGNHALELALGTGADTIVIDNWDGSSVLTVNDFDVSVDDLQITTFLNTLQGWDGSSNPFGAGFMQLAQDGADTLFQVDRNGGGDGYRTLTRLQNVDPTALSVDNFNPPYPPDGSGIFGSTFSGTDASETLNGTFGDDVLQGLAGADTLSGGNGNDHLIGGSDADTMTGGFGADTFVFSDSAEGMDTITDFRPGLFGDKLDIRDVLVGYDGDLGGFVQLSASGSDTVLSVDADGGADGFVALLRLENLPLTPVLLDDLAGQGNLVLM